MSGISKASFHGKPATRDRAEAPTELLREPEESLEPLSPAMTSDGAAQWDPRLSADTFEDDPRVQDQHQEDDPSWQQVVAQLFHRLENGPPPSHQDFAPDGAHGERVDDDETGVHKAMPSEDERPEHRVDDDDDSDDDEKLRQRAAQAAVAEAISSVQRQVETRRAETQDREEEARVEAQASEHRILVKEEPVRAQLAMAEAKQASPGRIADLQVELRSLRAERDQVVVVDSE